MRVHFDNGYSRDWDGRSETYRWVEIGTAEQVTSGLPKKGAKIEGGLRLVDWLAEQDVSDRDRWNVTLRYEKPDHRAESRRRWANYRPR